jgi:predicted RND superfamily exporter protein
MWTKVAELIIKYRLPLIVLIGIITVFMGYHATKVEMSYDINRTVPLEDPEMVFLNQTKEQFGEDGNIIGVGLKDSSVYGLTNFEEFKKLGNSIRYIPGVNNVLSLPELKILQKDTVAGRFREIKIFRDKIGSQRELDSLMGVVRGQQQYMGLIVNASNGATIMLVSVSKEVMNSSKRVAMTAALDRAGVAFTAKTKIQLHYAGIPYIRSVVADQVRKELSKFLYLSALVTGLIMFFFFRSFRAVLFSMVIIGVVVVWVMGTLALFGFKITLLSGLIPPVIVTIGITNAIYLLNKYHLEYAKLRDKEKAIAVVVNRMGMATFLTNLTVAIGFLTLLSTDILILREFGIVAGINIMALFIVSLIMIPGVFSWLPPPTPKHLRHLDFKILGRFVEWINLIVHRRRTYIYIVSLTLAVISAIGITRLHSVSFIVDDVPEESTIKKDLKFIEANFSGIMPLEVIVDTGKRKGVQNVKTLRKLMNLKTFLIRWIMSPDRFRSSLQSRRQNKLSIMVTLTGTHCRPSLKAGLF